MTSSEKDNRNKSKFSLKDTLNIFRLSTKAATEQLFGTTESFRDENSRDIISIKNTISDISSKYKKNTSDNIIEFFNSITEDDILKGNKTKKEKFESARKRLVNINKLIEHPEMFNVGEIFSQENNRFQRYFSYRMLYDNIPQMAQALNTYVDNILSPDDFTKNIFNIFIKDSLITSINNNDPNFEVAKNCQELTEIYNLADLTKEVVTECLKIGDSFYSVLKINEEMEKMLLTEESSLPKFNNYSKKSLIPNNIEISNEEIKILSEEFFNTELNIPIKPDSKLSESVEAYNKELEIYNEEAKLFEETSYKIKKTISDLINQNVLFTEDSSCLLEDNIQLDKDYINKNRKDLFNSFSDQNRNINNFDKTIKNKTQERINIRGSVVKKLIPERTIKLNLDQFNYGYLYVECLENAPDFYTTGAYSLQANAFAGMRATETDAPNIVNSKYKLITDVFIRNLSKKIDIKFINKNPDLKNTIYNLIKQDYILNKQIRIVYLKPTDVFHFGIGSDDYKDSIYKTILYIAKIYMAVLGSQVMLRIVRSPDKRVFYIEVDLDEDSEGTVQSFMRDIKTKDLKMSNFGQDFNTILQSIGTFDDYYIPIVNGNRPVEIDTIQGMNTEITNDFIEFLLKAMISGIGIPPEYLSYSEQTEFARSLGMMNGKFVRSIILIQTILGKQFTGLFRRLYENEYLDEIYLKEKKKIFNKLNKKDKLNNDGNLLNNSNDENDIISEKNIKNKSLLFDSSAISVKFPSPQSLNMQVLKERIDGVNEYSEQIVSVLVQEDDNELKALTKKRIFKDLLSNLDWTKYEKMVEEAKIEKTELNLAKQTSNTEDSGGGY